MYSLRSTSLVGAHLDAELTKRGAHTSGTTQRKQQRLQRFMDMETNREQTRETLRVTIQTEQRKVMERQEARAEQIRRSPRIISLIRSYLGH
jgi:hypothetical protein